MTPDPVGAADIAARLGVKPVTVRQWQARYITFPAPRWHVNGQAAWDWPDVEAWAATTGRVIVPRDQKVAL